MQRKHFYTDITQDTRLFQYFVADQGPSWRPYDGELMLETAVALKALDLLYMEGVSR